MGGIKKTRIVRMKAKKKRKKGSFDGIICGRKEGMIIEGRREG